MQTQNISLAIWNEVLVEFSIPFLRLSWVAKKSVKLAFAGEACSLFEFRSPLKNNCNVSHRLKWALH